MKKSIFIVFVALGMSSSAFAQFNTIGKIESSRIINKECCPSEPVSVPEDSIDASDTISVSTQDLRVGKEELISQYFSVSYPLKKIQIGSKFGMRMHPIYKKYMMHSGVDLHARSEDVLSMLPGTVVKVSYDDRSGNFVTVKTGNFSISYCHLSKQYVKVNDRVDAGNALGMSGSTGASTGEHLHITARKDGKAFNPVILLDYIRDLKERCVQLLVD